MGDNEFKYYFTMQVQNDSGDVVDSRLHNLNIEITIWQYHILQYLNITYCNI